MSLGVVGWVNSLELEISSLHDYAQQLSKKINFYADMSLKIGDQMNKLSDDFQMSIFQSKKNPQQQQQQMMQKMQVAKQRLAFQKRYIKRKENRFTTEKNQTDYTLQMKQVNIKTAKEFAKNEIKGLAYNT